MKVTIFDTNGTSILFGITFKFTLFRLKATFIGLAQEEEKIDKELIKWQECHLKSHLQIASLR